MIIGLIVLILLQVKYLSFEKQLVDSEKLIEIQNQRQNIVPSIHESNDDFQFSFDKFLSCYSNIEILRCYVKNPQKFIKYLADLIAFQIYLNLYNFIPICELSNLKQFIDNDNFIKLSAISKQNDISEIKTYLSKIKIQYLEVLVHLNIQDKAQNYYQEEFKSILSKIDNIYSVIKEKYNKNDIKSYLKLENFNLYNQVSLFEGTDYRILNNKLQSQLFEKTYIFRLSNLIYKNHKQDINIDKILANSCFKSISQSSVLKTRNYKIYCTTHSLFQIIEQRMKIESEQISENEYKSKLSSIEFTTIIANDKSIAVTNDKLNRKYNQHDMKIYPYFQHLIKDFKRMSLIFDNLNNIEYFVERFRKLFNKEYIFSDKELEIRLIEIKNGFNYTNSLDSKEQKDLKIILEIYNKHLDNCFKLEIQCNLKHSIRFKNSDHILYDFSRQNERILNFEQELIKQEQNEGQTRQTLILLKQIIIIASQIIIAFQCFESYKYQIDKFNDIKCLEGSQRCYKLCYSRQLNNETCQKYQKQQKESISVDDRIKFSCSQYNYNDLQKSECIKLVNQKQYSITYSLNDQYCIQTYYEFKQCKDDYNLMDANLLNSISIFKQDGFDQFIKYNDNSVKTNIQFLSDITNNLLNDETIIDVNFNKKNNCIYTDKRLVCGRNRLKLKEIYANNENTICQLLDNFLANCKYEQSSFRLGSEIIYNSTTIQIGSQFYCSIKRNYKIKCIYQSQTIQTPDQVLDYDIVLLKSSNFHICVINNFNELSCWSRSNTFGEVDILEEQKQTINYLDISDYITCGIFNEFEFICFGLIQYNQNEIPNVANIKDFSVASQSSNFLVNQFDKNLVLYYLDMNKNYDNLIIMREKRVLHYYTHNYHICQVLEENNEYVCVDLRNGFEYKEIQSELKSSDFISRSSVFSCTINTNGLGFCWSIELDQIEQQFNPSEQRYISVPSVNAFQITINGNLFYYENVTNNLIQYQIFLEKQDVYKIDKYDFNQFQFKDAIILVYDNRLELIQADWEPIIIGFDQQITKFDQGYDQYCVYLENLQLKCQDLSGNQILKNELNDNEVHLFSSSGQLLCTLFYNMEINCWLVDNGQQELIEVKSILNSIL